MLNKIQKKVKKRKLKILTHLEIFANLNIKVHQEMHQLRRGVCYVKVCSPNSAPLIIFTQLYESFIVLR